MRHYTIILISTISFLFSCNPKTVENNEVKNDYILITHEQFLTEKMELRAPQTLPFPETIHFSGNITTLAEGNVKLGVPVAGIINNILINVGEEVKKGQTLVEIGGNDFIDMQRDFVEAYVMLKQLKVDYERAEKLYNENISTEKDYILAESSYKVGMAKYHTLKQKLDNIGLNIKKIENYEFYSSYALKAPIKGYVTQLHVSLGQYTNQQDNIAEIINDEKLQLRLNIFEKNINQVKEGQSVLFHISGNKDKTFESKLRYIGKSINRQSKSIQCYADVPEAQLRFVNEQFVEGDIIINSDSVLALPESAFIKVENDYYLIVLINESKEGYKMNLKKVNIGRRSGNYFELKEKNLFDKVLIKGAHNIQVE